MVMSHLWMKCLAYLASSKRAMETFTPRGSVMRLLVLLAALPVWAAEDDPNEIVKRLIEAENTNRARASQYTYVEHADFFRFDKNSQPTKDRSETHQIVFVEGEPYKKLVARNEFPLEAKEQSKESKRLQRIAEDRLRRRRSGLFYKNVSMGTYKDLLTLFDNRLVGEEEVRGRKAWVIGSTPKEGRAAANAREKQVLSFAQKLWIDQADHQILKSVHTVVGNHIVFMPGTTITWEFEKINEGAWLAMSGVIDGRLQFARSTKPPVRTEYRNSNFQKFDVQSTITTDPAK
jgi:hypothetical protein